MKLDKNKVVVGMSGGVDSSAVAYLLKEQGYDVIGIHMKVWDYDELETETQGGCCSIDSANDALRICDKLGIPFYVVNFKEPFKKKVMDDFIEEYKQGRTPNPCIQCNRYIKFDELLKKAHELGAYYVATGHYAKIFRHEESGRMRIQLSEEVRKDQTYTLYNLSQDQLAHILMPLGDFSSKEEVREIASKIDTFVSGKRDSQEICFIPDDDYVGFLHKNGVKDKPGQFKSTSGEVIGEHQGLIHYTIGQRKGLGVTFGKPMYVVDLSTKDNVVILGDNQEVFSKGLIASDINFIHEAPLPMGEEKRVTIKIRYSAKPAPGTITRTGQDTLEVIFDQPQRAITPGQAVVFYLDNYVYGGGKIKNKI